MQRLRGLAGRDKPVPWKLHSKEPGRADFHITFGTEPQKFLNSKDPIRQNSAISLKALIEIDLGGGCCRLFTPVSGTSKNVEYLVT